MSADTPFGLVTAALLGALRRAVTDTDVSAGPPRADLTVAGVDVQLLGGRAGAPSHHPDRRRNPVTLEYVVAVAGPPEAIADCYHDTWVALHDSIDFDVDPDGVPTRFWSAFGVPPRPALLVSARVTLERELFVAAPVTEALIIRHPSDVPARSVRGRVILGGRQPAEGAVVSPLSSGLSATTGADGRFEILGAFDSDVVSLRVRHRHRQVVCDAAVDADPIDINLEGRN